MDIRRRVGLNLKKYRKQAGYSQEGLALECGIHRTYVSGVERGVRNPTVQVLEQLVAPLNVSASQLLKEIEDTEQKSKFAYLRQTPAEALAYKLQKEGRLSQNEIAGFIRENGGTQWPQELLDYIASRLDGTIDSFGGRPRAPDGAENRHWINMFYREILSVLNGEPHPDGDEVADAIRMRKEADFPDDTPAVASQKILAEVFFGKTSDYRKIRSLIRSNKP